MKPISHPTDESSGLNQLSTQLQFPAERGGSFAPVMHRLHVQIQNGIVLVL